MSNEHLEEVLVPIAREAENMARRMAVDAGLSEDDYEEFLIDAWDLLLPAEEDDTDD